MATSSATTPIEPLTESAVAAPPKSSEPFAFADWTWLNGNPRTKDAAMDTKFFTPEIRADVEYTYDFNHPKDDTIGGSSEIFRSNEVGLTQLGVGGDFHYDNVRARFMTQFGMYSETTPRNDASYSRGQWNLADAYRYLSEAYGGYHWDALHGINVDAGIFMSYVGLFSYYNFDNWAYQPSLRVVEYAVVLHRHAHSGLSHEQVKDRAVDHQRMAILRALQQPPRTWVGRFSIGRLRGSRFSPITTASAPTHSASRTARVCTPTTASR